MFLTSWKCLLAAPDIQAVIVIQQNSQKEYLCFKNLGKTCELPILSAPGPIHFHSHIAQDISNLASKNGF